MSSEKRAKPLSEDEVESIEEEPLSFDDLTEAIKALNESIRTKQRIVCKLRYQRDQIQRRNVAETLAECENEDKNEFEQDKKDFTEILKFKITKLEMEKLLEPLDNANFISDEEFDRGLKSIHRNMNNVGSDDYVRDTSIHDWLMALEKPRGVVDDEGIIDEYVKKLHTFQIGANEDKTEEEKPKCKKLKEALDCEDEENIVENPDDENWIPYANRKPADKTCVMCGKAAHCNNESDVFALLSCDYLCTTCNDIFNLQCKKHEYNGLRAAIHSVRKPSIHNERTLIQIVKKEFTALNNDMENENI